MENNSDYKTNAFVDKATTESIFESLDENVHLTDKEVFTQIWTSPRKVFKFIIDNNYSKYMYLILFLGGVISSLSRSASKFSGDSPYAVLYLFGAIVGGGFFGWIAYYIYSAIISLTGKWLDGTADTSTIFKVFTYSIIPTLFIIFLLIFEFALNQNGLQEDGYNFTATDFPLLLLLLLTYTIQTVLGIWSLVLLVIGLSEAQHFSVGKSILNLLIPVLIIVVPLFIIFLLVRI